MGERRSDAAVGVGGGANLSPNESDVSVASSSGVKIRRDYSYVSITTSQHPCPNVIYRHRRG